MYVPAQQLDGLLSTGLVFGGGYYLGRRHGKTVRRRSPVGYVDFPLRRRARRAMGSIPTSPKPSSRPLPRWYRRLMHEAAPWIRSKGVVLGQVAGGSRGMPASGRLATWLEPALRPLTSGIREGVNAGSLGSIRTAIATAPAKALTSSRPTSSIWSRMWGYVTRTVKWMFIGTGAAVFGLGFLTARLFSSRRS